MMQLGLSLGYWGAQPPTEMVPLVLEAERLGYDAVWTAESWGSDAFSRAGYVRTENALIPRCQGDGNFK